VTTAISCKGVLQLIEFAEDDGHQTLIRWPQPRRLRWADLDIDEYSIGGKLPSLLEIIRREGGSNFYFAYLNPDDNNPSIPTCEGILIVVSISSKDTLPLYSICYLKISIVGSITFEIISNNLQSAPSIEDCRKVYEQNKKKIKNMEIANFGYTSMIDSSD
jgi:hypothetical protein